MQQIPTFKELDDCIDFLFELLNKYSVLLTGVNRPEPSIPHKWTVIFEIPWIPSDSSQTNHPIGPHRSWCPIKETAQILGMFVSTVKRCIKQGFLKLRRNAWKHF